MRVASVIIFAAVAACGSSLAALDEVNDPSDDVALSKCRALARAAKADGSSSDEAYAAYVRCTQDAGLR